MIGVLLSIMVVLLLLGFPLMIPMIVAPIVALLIYFPNVSPFC